jgi:hypothetical protein
VKLFDYKDRAGYVAHAAAGGQTLTIWPGAIADASSRAPRCFKGLKEFGKIHDQDEVRLALTARKLGIRSVFLDRRGQPDQHIDLCRGPLEKAKTLAIE